MALLVYVFLHVLTHHLARSVFTSPAANLAFFVYDPGLVPPHLRSYSDTLDRTFYVVFWPGRETEYLFGTIPRHHWDGRHIQAEDMGP
jgi:hypothetical protein